MAAPATAAFLLLAGTLAATAGGEALYLDRCAACHQPGGIGTPGLAPPIASDELARMEADVEGRAYLPLVVLNGLSGPIKVAGQTYVSAMPAQPDLGDADIAAIATYVLATLNGGRIPDADAYAPAEVAALRSRPVTHRDLLSLRRRLEP